MNPTFDAFLQSWPWEPGLWIGLVAAAIIYARGWRSLKAGNPQRWTTARLLSFLGGLAAIALALASPIETFSGLMLQLHMVQHMLLMMVAPPLLWLGAPYFPLLRGLPRAARDACAAPLLRWPPLRQVFSTLTHPLVALPIFVLATWLWHLPAWYQLALRSPSWHYLQHVCFLGSALLFWYPVVRPYPLTPRWSRWLLFPYLILADVQNTVLAALFTFSSTVLYPHYLQVPRLAGISALADQAGAGVIMWVPGSLAFLLPLFALGVKLLGRQPQVKPQRAQARPAELVSSIPGIRSTRHLHGVFARQPTLLAGVPFVPASALLGEDGAATTAPITTPTAPPITAPRPSAPRPALDLLKVPIVGRFLRWRHARLCLQLPLLLLAIAVMVDGFTGPSAAPMNLAGVLPWIHWRGALILGLLVLGNLFCFGCPFVLPRLLARRWLHRRAAAHGRARFSHWTWPLWTWPRWLRNKWLAVALVALFLWSYEAFSLWDRPAATAWLTLGYFAAAFSIDGLFRGGTFCKYVCPIGQFNFVQSLVSPSEVRVREPQACATCRTHDCLVGRGDISGCELQLHLPRKSSNLDCTLCLDCVQACPHDNLGLIVTSPLASLSHDRPRAGIGRFSQRPDVAALVLLLVFGAFANAAGMVAPVVEWQQAWERHLGSSARLVASSAFYLVALFLLPALLVTITALASRRAGAAKQRNGEPQPDSLSSLVGRFAFALVPLGFAMWVAHYSFHFFTSYDTAIPAAQRFAADWGTALLGKPQWTLSCCRPAADWVLYFEILCLDVGLLVSLLLAWRIAANMTSNPTARLRIAAPWAVLTLLLFALGLWILFQPMEMRGTLPG